MDPKRKYKPFGIVFYKTRVSNSRTGRHENIKHPNVIMGWQGKDLITVQLTSENVLPNGTKNILLNVNPKKCYAVATPYLRKPGSDAETFKASGDWAVSPADRELLKRIVADAKGHYQR